MHIAILNSFPYSQINKYVYTYIQKEKIEIYLKHNFFEENISVSYINAMFVQENIVRNTKVQFFYVKMYLFILSVRPTLLQTTSLSPGFAKMALSIFFY